RTSEMSRALSAKRCAASSASQWPYSLRAEPQPAALVTIRSRSAGKRPPSPPARRRESSRRPPRRGGAPPHPPAPRPPRPHPVPPRSGEEPRRPGIHVGIEEALHAAGEEPGPAPWLAARGQELRQGRPRGHGGEQRLHRLELAERREQAEAAHERLRAR